MAFPSKVIAGSAGVNTVTAFNVDASEPVFMADERHPHYQAILNGLANEDPHVWELFDVGTGLSRRLTSITDRVSYDGKQILWDGSPVHAIIADQIRRALESGESNYEALAKFWEKLEQNPNEDSKAQAYDWLASHDFKITAEGDVVGYKGVSDNTDGTYSSWASSRVPDAPSAYVDGNPQPPLSKVTQKIGSVVTMPRAEVKHDPRQGCERGLHVATFDYASSYGNTVLEVHVNPRDIVSVPHGAHGANGEKVRACRYEVAGIRTAEASGASPVLNDEYAWEGDVGYKA